jgi:hypothetical protein
VTRIPSGGEAQGEQRRKHPATYSASILSKLDEMVPDGIWCDPFVGTGKLYQLSTPSRQFVGVELEAEWAEYDERTICGDSLELMRHWVERETHRFDGFVTSPVYGNRMSDHHEAKDGSRRTSYRHLLGRMPSEGSSATMYFWQDSYQWFHRRAWSEAWYLTRPDGYFFLNVKNFIRNGDKQNVVGWHMKVLREVGWRIERVEQVGTPGHRDGENADARYDSEAIIVARKWA